MRSRVRSLIDRRIPRRLVSLPLVVVLGIAALALSPMTLAAAAIADLFSRPRRWQRVRIVTLVTGGLVIEMIGLAASLLLWPLSGFGLLSSRPST